MSNVLILCDDFPPYGGLRAGQFYKNLTSLGWGVFVITFHHPSPNQQYNILQNAPNIHVIPQECIIGKKQKIIKRFFLPEEGRTPCLTEVIVKYGNNLIPRERIDVIFATSSNYHSVYAAAKKLSEGFKIPWIADFRDIEEQNNDFTSLKPREKIYRLRVKFRRFVILRNASFITSISQWHRRYLSKYNKRSELIFNGFERELLEFKEENNQRVFTVLYTGSLLNRKERDPMIFIRACKNLIDDKRLDTSLFKCVFIGRDSLDVFNYYNWLNASDSKWLITKEYEDHYKLRSILSSASLLLLLTSKHTRGVMTSKFFEYLAFKKPIALCPRDDGSISSIIEDLNLGFVCDNIMKVEKDILLYYQKWKNHESLDVQVDNRRLEIFTREYQAHQLDKLLKYAIRRNG